MVAAWMTLPPLPLFEEDENDDNEAARFPAEIFGAKGHGHDRHARPRAATDSSPNLSWHGGNIMSSVLVTPIFWGPNWGSADFTNDKMTGLRTFYMDIGNSRYAHTSDEYTVANGVVTDRSEEHTSELQSPCNLVCRLLLEKKKK